jgi:selenocysteine lyase/cysteine desulfurase
MAVPFLVDAAQTAGHFPIDMEAMRIDLLAFPGHKGLLGPLGPGLLCIRPGLERMMGTVMEGGTGSVSELDTHPETMPDKFEPGSHNTVGIAGLLAGVRYILGRGVGALWEHERALMARFIDGLHRRSGGELLPGLRLLGPAGVSDRVGVFSVTVEGMSPHDLAERLEGRFGVLTRPGIHCAPHVHRTFGTDPGGASERGEAAGATRFSLGPFLSLRDVAYATDALAVICEEHARDRDAAGV